MSIRTVLVSGISSKRHWTLITFVLWAVLFDCTGNAATIRGKVVKVVDGDSITVLDADHKQHRIRIIGIAAPEKKQPFWERSRESMVRMVAGKDVSAECHKIDRYSRQVCKVWVQPSDCPTCGKTLDVGHAQIIVGLALWYRQDANEQSAEDRGRYESAEQEARLRKTGLWKDEVTK